MGTSGEEEGEGEWKYRKWKIWKYTGAQIFFIKFSDDDSGQGGPNVLSWAKH